MASLIAFYEVALNLCIFLSRIETFMYGISFAPSKAIGLLLSTTGHSQTNGFLDFTRQRALARFGLRAALRRMRVTKALGLTLEREGVRGSFSTLGCTVNYLKVKKSGITERVVVPLTRLEIRCIVKDLSFRFSPVTL